MDRERLTDLFFKHYMNKLSQEEAEDLRRWLAESPQHREWMNHVVDRKRIRKSLQEDSLFDEGRAWKRFSLGMNTYRRRRLRFWLWGRCVAAVVLLLVLGGGIYWVHRSASYDGDMLMAVAPEIRAAGEGVTLSCSGHEQVLDAEEYDVADTTLVSLPLVHRPDELLTIDVGKGNSFRLVLDDGTEVYLNSDTRIIFPRHFRKKGKRDVTLLYGEAYFRVSHQDGQPFIVHVCNSEIEVLGTTFNVNAYANEPHVATTLVEGAVAFRTKNHQKFLLNPGMQTSMDVRTGITTVAQVDTSLYTSWVEGKFVFQSMDLVSIMRQIERWYDIKVEYEANVETDYRFRGMIDRDLSLQQVLNILEQVTDLTFTVEDRTVIITK